MFFLVVDDDELSRELLALLLEAEGREIELASSGEEALAKLDRVRPDVILMDVQMPGTSSDVLAADLRTAMPEGTVLLAMSGSRPPEKTLESCDGFLLKPFSADELEAKIVGLKAKGADLSGHRTTGLIERQLSVEEVSGADVPALNGDVYTKLSETMPAAHLDQMFDMCLADARVRIGLMAELAAAGDDVKYRAAAHAIKGGCGFIGATELYCLAEQAESYGLGPESGMKIGTTRAASTLEQLSNACERLERILVERARD